MWVGCRGERRCIEKREGMREGLPMGALPMGAYYRLGSQRGRRTMGGEARNTQRASWGEWG